MPVVNKQGYQVTFECMYCGKEYALEDMHYEPYSNKRICNDCLKVHEEFKDKERKTEKENR